MRPSLVGDRTDWDRFLLIRADAATDAAMSPRIPAGAILLVDRHYNSVEPYRRLRPNIYTVNSNDGCTVRYASAFEGRLVLRPHNPNSPVELVTIHSGRSYADYIIGRVCYVATEV